jgi:hypothetical protein
VKENSNVCLYKIQFCKHDVYQSACSLKMEAIFSFETSVDFQGTTRCYIPEDIILHSPHCKNLKYNIEKEPFNLLDSSKVHIGQINGNREITLFCPGGIKTCKSVKNARSRFLAFFYYFKISKRRLMRSHCCLSVSACVRSSICVSPQFFRILRLTRLKKSPCCPSVYPHSNIFRRLTRSSCCACVPP